MASRRPLKAHIPSAQCWWWGTYTQTHTVWSRKVDSTVTEQLIALFFLLYTFISILTLHWSFFLGTALSVCIEQAFQLDNYLFLVKPCRLWKAIPLSHCILQLTTDCQQNPKWIRYICAAYDVKLCICQLRGRLVMCQQWFRYCTVVSWWRGSNLPVYLLSNLHLWPKALCNDWKNQSKQLKSVSWTGWLCSPWEMEWAWISVWSSEQSCCSFAFKRSQLMRVGASDKDASLTPHCGVQAGPPGRRTGGGPRTC